MSAKERIEGLTHAWYGFEVFSALVAILQSGLGVFSLVWTAASLTVGLVTSYMLGQRLLNRSSLTRSFLLFTSVCSGLLGVWACYRYGSAFLGQWSFALVLKLALAVGSVMVNVRSFRVLTHADVKSYIR